MLTDFIPIRPTDKLRVLFPVPVLLLLRRPPPPPPPGRNSVVGIASPSGGARDYLFAKTRPGRSWGPPSLLQWVPGLFPEVKRMGRGVDHPPQSSAEVRTK